MGRCCVPGCRGNYDPGPKVHVFSFPKDGNRKDQWLRAIPRKDFTPSVNSKVCELHFQTSDFITMLTHCDEITGRTLEVDSDRVRLKADAVPPVFLNWLTYNHNACSARVSGLQASKD
ncbi:THAP domain-containing protein 2-like [Dermacentor silvarum]|uniref:THAP domain-containing protein 2-like n=1 Tax=Dermacentor silvarum TaxID=543639 RepID=UPI002100C1FA|nr:THAP domain-containing protein 2-like [Dermacentor silvarum]